MSSDRFLVQYDSGKLGLEDGSGLRPLSLTGGLDELLGGPAAADLSAVLAAAAGAPVAAVQRRAPIGRQEVWAAGVTYKRSEEAREIESNNSTIYTRVYAAQRPELFFKANGYDVVGVGESVGIRRDARWSVPEPELVVVLNAHLEVVGFTIGNDMSSRDIEGENPLYLPQAKVYEGACALGPRLWLQPGATQWPDVDIELTIERGGALVFSGQTSTAALHRSLSELVEYLGRAKRFPYGAFLFTGTGIVPPDTFTLAEGDVVRVRIEPIGELVNPVRLVGRA